MAFEDYYQLLGIHRTATMAQVRKAYRRMALRYHPDRNPNDPQAEDQFKKLTAAYDTISDVQKRADYDRTRNAFESAARGRPAEPKARPAPYSPPRQPYARPRKRPFYPLGFEQTLEENALDLKDLRMGVAAGAVVGAAYSGYPNFEMFLGLSITAFLAPWVGERVGFFLGNQLARLLRFEFFENPSGIEIPVGMGSLIPISSGLFGACAWAFASPLLGLAIAPGQVLVASLAAALAAPVGAAFGRAFTSVSERTGAKIFGVAIGIFVGLLAGAFVGGFLALFRMRSLGDERFSEIFFSAILGGALGAAFASSFGSLRWPTSRRKRTTRKTKVNF
jgi:hypothetical protein